MAVSGRNEPCPCGSGVKRKRCCGERAAPTAAPGAAIHLRDERLVGDMVAFAMRRFGSDWLAEPLGAYFEGLEAEPVDFQLFMPWVTHHWRVGGRTVREWFLEQEGQRLNEAERAWLLAQAPVTVVGRVEVVEGALKLETNSVKRADDMRARVEAACAGLLSHRTREHIDPEAVMQTADGAMDPGATGRTEAPEPEVLAALREFKVRQYEDWVDTRLPALKGKTPREAVRTGARQRKVDVLLKEMEHAEGALPEWERMDFSTLRRELGLAE